MKKDKKVNCYYKKIEWKVIRVWEHDISRNLDKLLNRIYSTI